MEQRKHIRDALYTHAVSTYKLQNCIPQHSRSRAHRIQLFIYLSMLRMD